MARTILAFTTKAMKVAGKAAWGASKSIGVTAYRQVTGRYPKKNGGSNPVIGIMCDNCGHWNHRSL